MMLLSTVNEKKKEVQQHISFWGQTLIKLPSSFYIVGLCLIFSLIGTNPSQSPSPQTQPRPLTSDKTTSSHKHQVRLDWNLLLNLVSNKYLLRPNWRIWNMNNCSINSNLSHESLTKYKKKPIGRVTFNNIIDSIYALPTTLNEQTQWCDVAWQ